MKKTLAVILSFIFSVLLSFSSIGCRKNGNESIPNGGTQIRVLVNWPGLSFQKPPSDDNPMANKIFEETGVRVKFEFSESDTVQKLTSVFAMASNMPDLIVTPYYGNGINTGYILKNAAISGLLVPFSDYYATYENLEPASYTGVEQRLYEDEIKDPDFKGKIYFMPFHTASSPEQEQNYGYGVYARRDILQTLNVDPYSIHTSEQLYDLAKRIKEYGFKDINGNAVIPMSCWQNGWSYEPFVNSFRINQLTSIYDNGDGTVEWMGRKNFAYEEAVFMKKCIDEDLFDQEALNQSTDTALQKHVNGSVALTGATFGHINVNLEDTLYKTNPEMKYVPIGPIYDAMGNARMPQTYTQEGTIEPAIVVMPNNGKKSKTEAVLKYLNYINSEDGRNLVTFGVEGEDWYRAEDGKIRMTETFIVNSLINDKYEASRGIGMAYSFGCYGIPYNDNENVTAYTDYIDIEELSQKYPDYPEIKQKLAYMAENRAYSLKIKEMYPVINVKGYNINSWDEDFEEYDMLFNILSTNDYSAMIFNCYFESSTAAIKIKLSNYNKAINQNGIMDKYLDYLEKILAEKKAQGVTVNF